MNTEIFATIYRENRWNGGSGPGSDPDFCRPLVGWFRRYVQDHRIRSLVDFGCGDMRWMPAALEGLEMRYTGLDAVASLIAAHRRSFPRWEFAVADVASVDADAIPEAELYWAKDVLQHWPDDAIVRFLDSLFAARPDAHVVVVNCSGQTGPRALDGRYHFAPLSPASLPLARYHPQPLFSWGGKAAVRLQPA